MGDRERERERGEMGRDVEGGKRERERETNPI